MVMERSILRTSRVLWIDCCSIVLFAYHKSFLPCHPTDCICIMQYPSIVEWKEKTSRWVTILQKSKDNSSQYAPSPVGSLMGSVDAVFSKEESMLPKALYAMSTVCVVVVFDKCRVSARVLLLI